MCYKDLLNGGKHPKLTKNCDLTKIGFLCLSHNLTALHYENINIQYFTENDLDIFLTFYTCLGFLQR